MFTNVKIIMKIIYEKNLLTTACWSLNCLLPLYLEIVINTIEVVDSGGNGYYSKSESCVSAAGGERMRWVGAPQRG